MPAPVFVDSDVLIWQLRGLAAADRALRRLGSDGATLWISAIQRIELLFHLRPGEEASARRLLARFDTEALTNDLIDRASEIYRYWNPLAGTGRFDAVIAATVIERGGVLVTNNVRHYPMPELRVEQGWDPGRL